MAKKKIKDDALNEVTGGVALNELAQKTNAIEQKADMMAIKAEMLEQKTDQLDQKINALNQKTDLLNEKVTNRDKGGLFSRLFGQRNTL